MSPEALNQLPEERAHPRSVLVVEDEILVRLELADLLQERGLRVLEAANAAEAIQVLEAGTETIDLVLTDVCMPGEADGLKFVEWLRETRPALPVVLCTSLTSLVPFGGPIIRKPYDPEKLVKQVEASLESSRVANPVFAPTAAEAAAAVDRARMYREKASEIRGVAEGAVDDEVKTALLAVAESYMQMAASLEGTSRY